MDKYLCERCGKDLVFRCAYSKIDHKLICAECDDKEQPKELMKKIQELEAKLAEKEKEYNAKCIYEAKFRKTLGNWQNQTAIAELEKVKDKISYYLLKFDYFTPKQLTQVEKMIKAIDQQTKSLKGEKKYGKD